MHTYRISETIYLVWQRIKRMFSRHGVGTNYLIKILNSRGFCEVIKRSFDDVQDDVRVNVCRNIRCSHIWMYDLPSSMQSIVDWVPTVIRLSVPTKISQLIKRPLVLRSLWAFEGATLALVPQRKGDQPHPDRSRRGTNCWYDIFEQISGPLFKFFKTADGRFWHYRVPGETQEFTLYTSAAISVIRCFNRIANNGTELFKYKRPSPELYTISGLKFAQLLQQFGAFAGFL